MATDRPATLQIDRIDAETLLIPIRGTAPLIVHNWSDKARKQMLDKMQGRKKVTEARDPVADYEASLYRIHREAEDGAVAESFGFPVLGFKAATIGAARFYDKSITMTALRQYLFFRGIRSKADQQELVEIFGDHEMREDPVRVGQGTADLRYRAQFPEWTAKLQVTYVRSSIDRNSVVSLIDAGGMGVGVGEWRPEKSGIYGTYEVNPDVTIEVL